jgi:putative endonuclease
MTAPHLLKGRHSEDFARHWLESKGLTHICSNFSCRFGELDLVMLDHNCLVVAEVRYRSNSGYGGALMSVTPAKQLRIARATNCFIQKHRRLAKSCLRFDVLALSGPAADPVVDWRRSAFLFDDS